ncbi:hypothetical protein ACFU9V_28075, partial [Streptomyces sp. NPDC057557]
APPPPGLPPPVPAGPPPAGRGPPPHAEASPLPDPGSAAAILIYENVWAGPLAAALRRSGGRLVANGRIPIQEVLASLDAAESRV